jgi:Flp pilus assembly protein TadG
MYRDWLTAHNQLGMYRGVNRLPNGCGAWGYRGGGSALGPRTWDIARTLRRRNGDERGAEMVEFAIVVVLLIAILYAIISYGLILAAQSTLTQAAADAARSGLVASSSAVTTAESQALTDVSWMDKGCNTPDISGSATGSPMTCKATEEQCPSNPSIECLSVTVSYNYSSDPLFPELPGLSIITPSTMSSTNVVQLGSVS